MTTVYFVRHAQPNFKNHDDENRELTWKGMEDRKHVTEFLRDKRVDAVLSSPYRRAVQTVEHFAKAYDLPIIKVSDFRERKVGNTWIDDFDGFCRRQWEDFDYKLADGESLWEVQQRNIEALHDVLANYQDQTVVVGSHGTALSTIISFYDASYGYEDFHRIKEVMPWIVMLRFAGQSCIEIREFNCV